MRTKQRGWLSTAFSVLLFGVVLVVFLMGTMSFSSGATDEGVAATREAIERAAVLCYATEGYYPPGLEYIREHYNVQVDESLYSVRYDIFSYNVRPVVTVVAR